MSVHLVAKDGAYAPPAQSDSPVTVIKAPSTPTRGKSAQLHPTTPERVSFLARHAISVSSPSSHTPPRKLDFPRDVKLGSPCDYHNPDKLDSWLSADGQPNKKFRDYARKLPGKAVDSTVIGSAKKDMEKIRLKRKYPDEEGEIEVTPTRSGPRKRIYKVHAEATTKENVRRLYPCSGPNIVTLTGKEKGFIRLIGTYPWGNAASTFEKSKNLKMSGLQKQAKLKKGKKK